MLEYLSNDKREIYIYYYNRYMFCLLCRSSFLLISIGIISLKYFI